MKKFTKILLAVDFAPQSILMAHQVRAMAQASGAEIVAVHAMRPFELMVEGMDVPGAVVLEWYEAQKPLLERQLTAFCQEHLGACRYRTFLVEGDPAGEILRIAHAESADLVVLATHGFGVFRRLILGSVAAKVLHDSPLPVLTGAHLQEPRPGSGTFRKIVVGVDLAARTGEVLAAARELGAEEITVVHAMPVVGDGVQPSMDPSWRMALQAAVRTTLQEAIEKEGLTARTVIEAAGPAQLIRRVAVEQGADLVVIGRHSDHSLLGRLTAQAYSIVRESPCPVLSL
ncbi:MAG: universal stress protein [Acidobacteriaceae bacterium]|nr:universal stress protein [Acidobacteriaceae bacterium]